MRSLTSLVTALIALSSAMQAQAGDVFNGRQIYLQQCTSCHGDNGVPMLPGTPNLARGEGLLAPDQILLHSLRFGKGLMPGFESILGRRELLDVLAYVRTLQR